MIVQLDSREEIEPISGMKCWRNVPLNTFTQAYGIIYLSVVAIGERSIFRLLQFFNYPVW